MGNSSRVFDEMLFIALICSLSLAATGQQVDDDWIDPYDMLNYDASTKSMRKPAEPSNYPNVPTKRREYTEDSGQKELSACNQHLQDLQKQNEDQQKKITLLSQQPTYNPVFKRFLSRLLKEIERVGLPSDNTDAFYDAKIRVSKQTIAEIKALLDGEESCRTGALDNAVSQLLTDLRQHDYKVRIWHFEDTFGVEVDTVVKILLGVLLIVAIICTELWSVISWFVQFRRLFAVCFFISVVWNWFYLYKIAFAEHQSNLVKMDVVNEKCTGVKKIDWSDSLKEWFRSTWTLQDDPCKRYYEVLMVNPILLVPPTKAISVTLTTFITEPLKHFGQGISEFLRALLKDLPVQLQIPVLLTIVLSILVVMYGGVNAAFQHGITAPFRRGRRDPRGQIEPPPERHLPRIEGHDHLGGGDTPPYVPQRQAIGDERGNQVRQRDINRGREQKQRIIVQNVGILDHGYNNDDMDGDLYVGRSDTESEEPTNESQIDGASNLALEHAEVDSTQSKTEQTLNKKPSGASKEGAEAKAQPNINAAKEEPSPTDREDVREQEAADINGSSANYIESIGHPVQETSPGEAQ